jgi:hypothetical protein
MNAYGQKTGSSTEAHPPLRTRCGAPPTGIKTPGGRLVPKGATCLAQIGRVHEPMGSNGRQKMALRSASSCAWSKPLGAPLAVSQS